MYELIFSDRFQKQLRASVKGNNTLKNQVLKTVSFLHLDVNHPSLRLHKLSGQNNWSVSVNKSIRVILHLKENKIFLLDIGKHEDLY